jgi:thioesterase III
MKHSYTLQILERHLDTFGHVNNATYLEMLEEARWEWVTNNGYGLKEVQTTRKGPVILECQIKFRRELHLRETIRIESQLVKYERNIGEIHQWIYKENDVLSAEAKFTMAFFDLEARKLIPPTEEWLRALR